METVGILCATPEELSALRAELCLDGVWRRHGPTSVCIGKIDDLSIILAQCGVGKVNAAAAATLLLAMHGVDAVIFSGVAGSLDPHLGVGSVVLANGFAVYDYGYLADENLTPTLSGEIPIGAAAISAPRPVSADVAMNLDRLRVAVAERLQAPVRLGPILTADHFLNCGATRERLREQFGGDAIDMESGAVAQVCEAWGAPLYAIRTLSDLAGPESHIGYTEMAAIAATRSAVCVSELLPILTAGRTPR